ncbi:MAG: hypothetical protein EU531_03975 [Promethearchaeota archaeon]|nr:MAG: hypothetical protein EU531_03975 [Candidatus Lokiarchaeota archaeon]
MDISQEFVELIKRIDNKLEIPLVDKIFIPSQSDLNKDRKKANFGAIKLTDGSTGIFFIGLDKEFHEIAQHRDLGKLSKEDPVDLTLRFNEETLFDRTIGLGAINAISHFLFTRSKFQFRPSNHILKDINVQHQDIIGMVGYFPPLVKKINSMGNKLIVIELKQELIKEAPHFEITLDATKLTECNKIICTSTTLINNTLEDILHFTGNAEIFALIGPTAGFLPDPIFKRKVNIIGGSIVNNSEVFFKRIIQGERWGDAVSKFLLMKTNYPGIKNLINLAK